MQYSVIENLLKEKIGLDPASIGSSSISRVIRRRFSESGYDDLDEYTKILVSSEDELRALVEEIVIPETWFFRDGRPFMLLNDFVKERWSAKKTDDHGMLRVLSVPCSTGEEPYSIAMVLSDLNFPIFRCQIDAVDVSSRVIAHARRGVYRENSFRGDEMDFRYRYFEKINKEYKLSSKICEMVNYFQGNLLDSNSFSASGPYHVIFCRNLLIYFDRSDQKRAIATLHNLLASDGILFIGHAEANQNLNDWFTSMKYRGAFAYRKSVKTETVSKQSKKRKYKSHNNIIGDANVLSGTAAKSAQTKYLPLNTATIEQFPDPSAELAGQLDYIQQLADEGQLSKASLLCEQYLYDHPDSVQAYYLLGVLYDAVGDINRSADMFRKTIYLDPDHHEALLHLSLHAERSGNTAVSNNLKRRAKRAVERHKPSIK